MKAAQLELKARLVRVRLAALRAAIPDPGTGELAVILDLMYSLADDIASGLEVLADVEYATERALEGDKNEPA